MKSAFFLPNIIFALAFTAVLSTSPGLALAEDPPAVGVKQGEMYPDFLLPTVGGEHKRFSDYRGKKILLFHFASW